jgi:uncharacterized membrane protein
MMLSMLYTLPLLGSLLLGLILLALGVVLLFKVKNKLAGILVIAVGLVFSLLPIAVYLFLMINVRVQG